MVAELGHGGRETPPRKIDWIGARTHYCNDTMTLNAICAQYGMSREELLAHAQSHRWDNADRPRTSDDHKLLNRLFWGLEQVIESVRTIDLTEMDAGKEAAALGRLVVTLDRMIEMRERKIAKPQAQQSREMVELRKRLGKRLEELGIE